MADDARPTDLLDLCRRVVDQARAGEQVEAYAARGRRTAIKTYEEQVESFTSAESAGIGVRVILEGREGFASAGMLDESVLAEVLEEARDNAEFAEPDDHVGLAHPDPDRPRAKLDLFRDGLEAISTEEKIGRALELERMVRGGDPRIRGVRSSGWSDAVGEHALASTTGIASANRMTTCSVSVGALAEDGGQTQIAGGMSYGRGPDEIDLDEAATEAVSHAVRLLGATKPASTRLTAVLMPSVTASFLGIIGSILSGEAVLKGRSLFANRVGEEVAAPIFTLADDATDSESFGAAVDDDEGLASRRNELIAGGVLQGFLYDTYSGRRAGSGSTGSAVRGYGSTPSVGTRGLALVPGERGHEELIGSVSDGVLVQSVSGLHSGVNRVSGDFSVGAAGLMIRNGRLAEPVQEMTIASTVQRMLQDVAGVGNDVRWLGSTAGVTLVIDDVSLGGR